MKICIPYTEMVGHLFRCLCHDFGIEFVEAPVPGKYTAQIGKCFAENTLCTGLEGVLGSVSECYYLGADTAFVFAPCGGCSEQRIRARLANCLEANGLKMHLFCVTPHAAGNKALFAFLKEHGNISYFNFLEAKRLFFACTALMERFAALKRGAEQVEVLAAYTARTEKELEKVQSLLDLKIRLSAYVKKLCALVQESTAAQSALPYSDSDYFRLAQCGVFSGFFERGRRHFAVPTAVQAAPPGCAEGGDFSLYINKI